MLPRSDEGGAEMWLQDVRLEEMCCVHCDKSVNVRLGDRTPEI